MIHSVTYKDRSSWLAGRRVGGSDAGMLWDVGFSSQSLYACWAEKALGIPIDFAASEQRRLDIGTALEPFIRRMFTAETGLETIDDPPFTLWLNSDYPFMSASLDTKTHRDGELVSVECKNVGRHNAHEWDGDGLPLMYQAQSCHQSIVLGASGGYVIGLLAGEELAVRWVPVDPEFAAAHIELCRDFWHLVETKTPPPIDGTNATTEAIKRRWPKERGPRVDGTEEIDQLTEEIERWENEQKVLADCLEKRRNRLRELIGDAEGIVSPSGVEWTWKVQKRAGYVVEPGESRVLRRVGKRKAKA